MALEPHKKGVNSSEVPLVALKHSTRSVLSQALNGTKVIPSPSNLPRDWRGLAHLAGVTSPHVNCPDPTGAILSAWERKENSSVQALVDYLKEIDRWDVIEDTAHLVEKDILDYSEALETSSQCIVKSGDQDSNILTIDDVSCIENCGLPQYYDAFLLFDDSDREFALTILEKLENEYGLKLCCKDRDLIGGLPFEHEAIMQLIRDRCRRLIVVVSPLFLESTANKFLLNFAQAVGIEQQQRKIIPCVYSKFKFPPQLLYYFVLDYTRTSNLWNFWDRLSHSIKAASNGPKSLPPSTSDPVQIVEHPDSSTEEAKSLSVEKWDCKKVSGKYSTSPSAPPCEESTSSLVTSKKSYEPHISNNNISEMKSTDSQDSTTPLIKSDSNTLESLSVHSEPEPTLPSRTSSTASLLSKVFHSRKPKFLRKKKKKIPIAL